MHVWFLKFCLDNIVNYTVLWKVIAIREYFFNNLLYTSFIYFLLGTFKRRIGIYRVIHVMMSIHYKCIFSIWSVLPYLKKSSLTSQVLCWSPCKCRFYVKKCAKIQKIINDLTSHCTANIPYFCMHYQILNLFVVKHPVYAKNF